MTTLEIESGSDGAADSDLEYLGQVFGDESTDDGPWPDKAAAADTTTTTSTTHLDASIAELDRQSHQLHRQLSKITSQLDDLARRRRELSREQERRQGEVERERYGGRGGHAAPALAAATVAATATATATAASSAQRGLVLSPISSEPRLGIPVFSWSERLKELANSVFCIKSFRHPQEGIMNAVLDHRDIVVIMPTGGGKSLTYQLPALLSTGLTLVISPLVSLIQDQVWHLNERGVAARLLTGASSPAEIKEILGVVSRGGQDEPGRAEVKLVYVTPERIAKSKQFMSALEKAVRLKKLERIVIDEAHCCSQLGHDFRPDYKKLSVLRTVFTDVPIIALTATCPPAVLTDVLSILKLSKMGKDGTLLFSAPLYRPNLRYAVLPKPNSMQQCLQKMADWIESNHSQDSGIIYCLSKKETSQVSDGLAAISKGKIKCGLYHADLDDRAKEQAHAKWRTGEIKVVVSTIAFGMGIDKANVRFVLHQTISKSMENYLQESGRAGRDGLPSDCVLFYRPQDASRISSLTAGEKNSDDKVHQMLAYAQNLSLCRKLLFAEYFNEPQGLAPYTDPSDAAPCTHCDNCTRSPDDLTERDVTIEAWSILRLAQYLYRQTTKYTVQGLIDIIKAHPDGDHGELTIPPMKMSRDDIESLLINLVLEHYLQEDFHYTAYAIITYIKPGPRAYEFTRQSLAEMTRISEEGQGLCQVFLKPASTKRRRTVK